MIKFTATLQKFKEQGEKTGWTYIDFPSEIAQKVKPNYKKSFRIKGTIDNYAFKGLSILPMGEGDFILPINATIRKNIKKFLKGEKIVLQIEEDKAPVEISADLMACLEDETKAKTFFLKLPKSHQNYYSKWIESAKTDATKAKRIALAINGFNKHMNYPEMMRANKEGKL
ncbi:MAG TPA: YdeI/OmpD-associated family protein [Bacteroidia bacterium]|nr:YdeI/OmpD-associated family protein [Bacteroidia bacterium]